MVMAMGFDDAKQNQIQGKGDGVNTTGGVTQTPFFGGRNKPGMAHAALAYFDPGRISRAHFHMNDQFQVILGGKGTLGKHDLAPYGVHFSRAYTPYGPLVSGAGTGMTFFVMRAHSDPGSQRLPDKLDKLKQIADRKPWQITRQVSFPKLPSSPGAADIMLQADPDIKDERGLAVYTLSMKSNAQTLAPDPASGDGQYLVVVKGSLIIDDKEHKAFALVFIKPDEGQLRIRAGAQGLEAIVLNFPRPLTATTTAASTTAATAAGLKTWQCSLCSFVYDEAAGMPEEGIAPGTRWQDVPESWSCPDCSASKADFQMAEVVH